MTESELKAAAEEAADHSLFDWTIENGSALRKEIVESIIHVANAHAAGLREENERLKRDVGGYVAMREYDKALSEVAALKAEVERLRGDVETWRHARDWAEFWARKLRYEPSARWCSVFEEGTKAAQAQLLAEYFREASEPISSEVAALKAEVERLTQSHIKWERVTHEAASEIERLKHDIQDVIDDNASHRGMSTEIGQELYSRINEWKSEIETLKAEVERLTALETAQPVADSATCRETFGSKSCVRPAGHDGHHESRSGSAWGIALIAPDRFTHEPAPSAPEQERCNATATHQDRKHTCTAPVGHDGPHYGGKAFGWYDDWPSSTPHTPQPAKEKAAADALTRESRAEYEQPAPAVEGEPRRYPVDCTCFCMWERTQERDAARAEVDKLRAELAAYKEQLDESAGYAHDREIECKVALGQVEHLRAELAKACEEARMQKARKESYQEDAVQLRAINEQLTLQLEAAHDWWCKAPNFDRGGDE
jgi:chemotaxis protein histidine kinase CheA